jgi:hypothetical protein
MKKLILLTTFCFFIISQINAQTIRWGTKSISPGTKTEEGFAIAADSLGNNYITGSYTDTIWFGPTMLKGKGLKDVFVVKLDSNGQYIWAKTFGSTGNDEGLGISVDNAGNIFVTGYFNNTIHFTPTDSLVSFGSSDIFVAKLNNNGTLLFKIQEGTVNADYGRSIWAHPTNGEFAVVGDKNGTTIYIANYYNTGTREWYKDYYATVSATATGVCMDNSGNVYASGYFKGNMNPPNLVSLNSIDAFAIIISNTGSLDDYYNFGGTTSNDYAYSIYCNGPGTRFYLCGSIGATTNFGDDAWGTNYTLTGSGAFITAFDKPGTWWWTAWAKKSAFSADAYLDINADKFGNVIVAGSYMATISYNSWGGTPNWSTTPSIGSTTSCANNSVATDKFGNIYTTGKFRQTFGFGDSTLVTDNYMTVFTQKISTPIIKAPAAGSDKCISQVQGDSLLIQLQPSMKYKPGNVFTLQVDTTGTSNFTNPISIGTLNSTGSGTIHSYLPTSLSDVSIAYLRVISSNPASTTGDQTYVYINPRPIPDLSVDSIFRCASGTSAQVTVYQDNPLGGGWGYSYQWSPTNGLSGPTSSTTDVYPSVSTNYTLTTTDIDNQCTGTAVLHAISWPTPTLFVGNDTIICKGTSLTLHATGTNIATYNWTPTSTLQFPATANPIVTPTAVTTNYICQVASSHGCTQNDNIYISTITVNVEAGANINTCLGGAVQLSGTSSGTVFSWNPVEGLSNPNIANPIATPLVTTKYYLTGTETNYGCHKKDSIMVNVGIIGVNVNDATITCGSSASLTAGPVGNYVTPLTYSWSPPAGLSATTGSTVTANPIDPSVYYVVMTTGNGCSGFDTSKVTVNSPNFNINFSSTQQLFTTPPFAVQFTNSTPSMANYTFTWLWGDGTSTQNNNATVFHVYSYNGNYDVALIAVSNSTGCRDTLVRGGYIFCMNGTSCLLTAAVSTPQGINACQGDTLLLNCNTGAGYSYQWNLNGNPISGAVSPAYNATVQGQYSVTIGDGSCNVVSQPVLLHFDAPPSTPTITKTGSLTLCGGGTVFLTASSGYSNYHWNTGQTTQNITISQSGTYTVTVSMSAGGCTASASYDLNASAMNPPEICIAGVDSASNHNIIVWEPPVSAAIDSFLVYREGTVANVFEKIGAVEYNGLSTFIDAASNPRQQAYRYNISILDTCGIETLQSEYHKTVHLTINSGIGGSWNLIWNHYEGFPFGSYNIYRGTDSSNMSLLTTIASTFNSYTDLTPPVGLLYYQLEVVKSTPCNTAKSINYTRSNIADNGEAPGAAPNQPGPISGNINACQGNTAIYSVSPVPGATSYTWTLPAGWAGNSTADSIIATAGTTGGTITVTANNINGSSPAQTVAVSVTTILSQPSEITGNAVICASGAQNYSVVNDPAATSYTWTLPSGWSGNSTTNSISTTAGTNGGTISVVANNICGASSQNTLNITVNPLPSVTLDLSPIDTLCDNGPNVTLTGGNPTGGIYSGIAVVGVLFSPSLAGAGSHTITYAYTDGNSCTNNASGSVFIDVCTDVEESGNGFTYMIYPNPLSGKVTVEISGEVKMITRILVMDITGKTLLQFNTCNSKMEMDLSTFSAGVYILKVEYQDGAKYTKLLKQ